MSLYLSYHFWKNVLISSCQSVIKAYISKTILHFMGIPQNMHGCLLLCNFIKKLMSVILETRRAH
jgi:hypothetical protein